MSNSPSNHSKPHKLARVVMLGPNLKLEDYFPPLPKYYQWDLNSPRNPELFVPERPWKVVGRHTIRDAKGDLYSYSVKVLNNGHLAVRGWHHFGNTFLEEKAETAVERHRRFWNSLSEKQQIRIATKLLKSYYMVYTAAGDPHFYDKFIAHALLNLPRS